MGPHCIGTPPPLPWTWDLTLQGPPTSFPLDMGSQCTGTPHLLSPGHGTSLYGDPHLLSPWHGTSLYRDTLWDLETFSLFSTWVGKRVVCVWLKWFLFEQKHLAHVWLIHSEYHWQGIDGQTCVRANPAIPRHTSLSCCVTARLLQKGRKFVSRKVAIV